MAKLLTNIKNIEEVDLFPSVDGFIIANKSFSIHNIATFGDEEVINLINKIKANNKECYLNINKIFHEGELKKIKDFLMDYMSKIDGFLFSDFAIFSLAKELNIVDKLIFYSQTQIVNSYDAKLILDKGIKAVMVSKEMPLSTIEKVAKFGKGAMIAHGYQHLFYSKRNLISLYNEKYHKNFNQINEFKIKEKTRDTFFPILEEENGFNIFTDYILETFDIIYSLKKQGIDYFIIDGNFLPLSYRIEVVRLYSLLLNGEKINKLDFLNNYPELIHSSGCLFKQSKLTKEEQ